MQNNPKMIFKMGVSSAAINIAKSFQIMLAWRLGVLLKTAKKMSVFGVILVRIFPHSD